MSRLIDNAQLKAELEKISFTPTMRTFALEVKGDAMAGRHILDGDYAILEHGMEPKSGDVVATYLDNKSALRTYFEHKGKPFLKTGHLENPDWIPAGDLVIQGVMVALIRRFR